MCIILYNDDSITLNRTPKKEISFTYNNNDNQNIVNLYYYLLYN